MWNKIMLRKRCALECINHLFKEKVNLVHSRYWSVHNFIINLCSALAAYCFLRISRSHVPVHRGNTLQLELFELAYVRLDSACTMIQTESEWIDMWLRYCINKVGYMIEKCIPNLIPKANKNINIIGDFWKNPYLCNRNLIEVTLSNMYEKNKRHAYLVLENVGNFKLDTRMA